MWITFFFLSWHYMWIISYLWVEQLPAAKARRRAGSNASISTVLQKTGQSFSWKHKVTLMQRNETSSCLLGFIVVCLPLHCSLSLLLLYPACMAIPIIETSCQAVLVRTNNEFVYLPPSSFHISAILFPCVRSLVCRCGCDHSIVVSMVGLHRNSPFQLVN